MKFEKHLKNAVSAAVLIAGLGLASGATAEESAGAADAKATLSNYAEVENTVRMLAPGAKIESIKPVDLTQLYEVSFGAEVAYVTKDGRYMFLGDLVDITAKENLTENQRAVARKKLVANMDPASLIVFGAKQPKHTLTVFTDIDCGYCRKMHSEMADYEKEGIQIRYAAFPRAGIPSESYDKAVAAWCAKDRQAALTDAKAGKKLTKAADDCVNPVKEHYNITRQLRLDGTPTLVLEDGTVIPGYVPAARLRAMLEQQGG